MNSLQADCQTLYETDYLQWIETTVEKLRIQDHANVDWDNLIEEIEDMGRSERRSLKSNLIVVLVHLLKWQYQPETEVEVGKVALLNTADVSWKPSTTHLVLNLILITFLMSATHKQLNKQRLKLDCHWRRFQRRVRMS